MLLAPPACSHPPAAPGAHPPPAKPLSRRADPLLTPAAGEQGARRATWTTTFIFTPQPKTQTSLRSRQAQAGRPEGRQAQATAAAPCERSAGRGPQQRPQHPASDTEAAAEIEPARDTEP